MLIIRPEQMHTLARMRTEEFTERMVRYAAAEFPDDYARLGAAGMRRFVEETIQTGRTFEVDSDAGLAVLVQLTLMFGPLFERSPDAAWANEMLAMKHVPDTIRLGMIRRRLSERTQGRAIRRYNPSNSTES